ncbi:MAG TPA: hypothetical protein VHM88_10550 [Candidatus Acidoferrales bacterium]|jgi:hypothetical protein|nr:hypothetical protein [Candidatus Acidoferrales bacterium]
MLDILFGLLEMFLEVFLEAAVEFAAEFLGAAIWRAVAAEFERSGFKNPGLAWIGYVLLGGVAGALSLLFFPHSLVHPSRVPGLSVIISPILAGLGMWWVGSTVRKWNKKPMQIESFSYGFAFALGMALVRFFFTKRT